MSVDKYNTVASALSFSPTRLITDKKLGVKEAQALASCRTLTRLKLGYHDITDNEVMVLSLSLSLKSLDISNIDVVIGLEAIKTLALSSLTRLNIRNMKIGDDGAKALALSTSLTSLNISRNRLGYNGAKALSLSPFLKRLHIGGNDIGLDGVKVLASSSLTSLDMSGNYIGCRIGEEGAKALAVSKSLTSLNLRSNSFGANGAKVLSLSPSLMILNITENDIGNEGARALATSKSLTKLNISHNNIGNEGIKALASSTSLMCLNISENFDIGEEGVKALAMSQSLTNLTARYIKLGDDEAKALATSKYLVSLNVSHNYIGTRGATALASSSLTSLDVSRNHIGNEGAKALAMSRTLKSLNVGYNSIKEKVGERIYEGEYEEITDIGWAKALSSSSLTSLDVSGHYIGDETAKALSMSQSLISLNLKETDIGDEGAKALASTSLTSLDVNRNYGIGKIGPEGATALSLNTTLTSLNIYPHQLGSGAKALYNMQNNREKYNTELKQTLRSIPHLSKDVTEHILYPLVCLQHIDVVSGY